MTPRRDIEFIEWNQIRIFLGHLKPTLKSSWPPHMTDTQTSSRLLSVTNIRKLASMYSTLARAYVFSTGYIHWKKSGQYLKRIVGYPQTS